MYLFACAILMWLSSAAFAAPAPGGKKTFKSAAIFFGNPETTFWKNHTIEVCWETPGYERQKELVRQAIEDSWVRHSDLSFWRWNDCAPHPDGDIRIAIEDTIYSPYSAYPASRGREKFMSLNFEFTYWGNDGTFHCGSDPQRQDFCIEMIAVHEFGHAIGLAHEQERHDVGDTHMDCAKNYTANPDVYPITPYDRDSIMNYCRLDRNKKKTLSQVDIDGVQAIYGRSFWDL